MTDEGESGVFATGGNIALGYLYICFITGGIHLTSSYETLIRRDYSSVVKSINRDWSILQP